MLTREKEMRRRIEDMHRNRGLILSADSSGPREYARRIRRLTQVAVDMDRRGVALSSVARIHDDEGILFIVWQARSSSTESMTPPLPADVRSARRAWEGQNENGDMVRHAYGGPSAPPHVFPDYDFFDEDELLRRGMRDQCRESYEKLVRSGVPRENLPDLPELEAL